ncbi:MAG: REP-associated tyrosine transposase, partial [Thermodesulfobacteriota bacterium]
MGGSTYFVTFRTRNIELPPIARKLVLEACLYFDNKKYHLWAAVVMPDHVHLLLTPMEQKKGEWYSLSEILHSIKSFTAKKINKILNNEGNVWQDESFDRIVRDEKEFLEKWEYIRNNPLRRGLCSSLEEWENFYEHTGKMPEQTTGKMPEKTTGKMPEQTTGKMPVQTTGKMPVQTTGKMPVPPEYLTPVAYIWTRTVPCKNPGCGAIVPLVRQTWLCKKPGRYIALRVSPSPLPSPPKGEGKLINPSPDGGKDKLINPSPDGGKDKLIISSPLRGEDKGEGKKAPIFTIVQSSARSETKAVEEFGFDPGKFSKGGNSTCVFCGTVADSDYVKKQAQSKMMGQQLMAVVCTKSGEKGKIYLAGDEIPKDIIPPEEAIQGRISKLCNETGITVPDEDMDTNDPTTVAGRGFGITKWHELFTPRQLL